MELFLFNYAAFKIAVLHLLSHSPLLSTGSGFLTEGVALLRNPWQCLLSQNSGGSTASRHS